MMSQSTENSLPSGIGAEGACQGPEFKITRLDTTKCEVVVPPLRKQRRRCHTQEQLVAEALFNWNIVSPQKDGKLVSHPLAEAAAKVEVMPEIVQMPRQKLTSDKKINCIITQSKNFVCPISNYSLTVCEAPEETPVEAVSNKIRKKLLNHREFPTKSGDAPMFEREDEQLIGSLGHAQFLCRTSRVVRNRSQRYNFLAEMRESVDVFTNLNDLLQSAPSQKVAKDITALDVIAAGSVKTDEEAKAMTPSKKVETVVAPVSSVAPLSQLLQEEKAVFYYLAASPVVEKVAVAGKTVSQKKKVVSAAKKTVAGNVKTEKKPAMIAAKKVEKIVAPASSVAPLKKAKKTRKPIRNTEGLKGTVLKPENYKEGPVTAYEGSANQEILMKQLRERIARLKGEEVALTPATPVAVRASAKEQKAAKIIKAAETNSTVSEGEWKKVEKKKSTSKKTEEKKVSPAVKSAKKGDKKVAPRVSFMHFHDADVKRPQWQIVSRQVKAGFVEIRRNLLPKPLKEFSEDLEEADRRIAFNACPKLATFAVAAKVAEPKPYALEEPAVSSWKCLGQVKAVDPFSLFDKMAKRLSNQETREEQVAQAPREAVVAKKEVVVPALEATVLPKVGLKLEFPSASPAAKKAAAKKAEAAKASVSPKVNAASLAKKVLTPVAFPQLKGAKVEVAPVAQTSEYAKKAATPKVEEDHSDATLGCLSVKARLADEAVFAKLQAALIKRFAAKKQPKPVKVEVEAPIYKPKPAPRAVVAKKVVKVEAPAPAQRPVPAPRKNVPKVVKKEVEHKVSRQEQWCADFKAKIRQMKISTEEERKLFFNEIAEAYEYLAASFGEKELTPKVTVEVDSRPASPAAPVCEELSQGFW